MFVCFFFLIEISIFIPKKKFLLTTDQLQKIYEIRERMIHSKFTQNIESEKAFIDCIDNVLSLPSNSDCKLIIHPSIHLYHYTSTIPESKKKQLKINFPFPSFNGFPFLYFSFFFLFSFG